MKEIRYKPIGIIHSPFKDIIGMPLQPTGAKGIKGTIEIEPEYIAGLKDAEGFSHIAWGVCNKSTQTPKFYRDIGSQTC